MSNDLIHRYVDLVAKTVDRVNPHEPNTREHALYEAGLLRAILSQCILSDSKNKWIMDRVVKTILEQGS